VSIGCTKDSVRLKVVRFDYGGSGRADRSLDTESENSV